MLDVEADVTVSNSYLYRNSGNEGGALACGGHLKVNNSTFIENTSPPRGANPGGGGGVGGNLSCVMEITNSTFIRNSSEFGSGGAINNYGGKAYITNNTLYANRAPKGGGLYANQSDYALTIVTHNTIVGNTSSSGGSGIYNDSASPFTLRNTIVANNTGSAQCSGTITNGGNNLRFPVNDASCPGIVGDPKLLALADNGGLTQTMALQPGSAALDKIPAAIGCNVGVSTDQRGVVRPQNSACDIGAFELQAPSEVPEADTLLLLGGGLGGLATWMRYQWSRRKPKG